MLLVIEKDKGKKILDKYFEMLAYTGYVKHPVVSRYLAWLFLFDFVERVYERLTDDDYTAINNALICLFNGGNCLLPYLTKKAPVTIADNIFVRTFSLRSTELESLRSAYDNFRQTES